MTISVQAPAKINLTLEVLGRRRDGYHNILSVLQTLDLCDTLTLGAAGDIELRCNIPELEGADNLVFRAAQLLKTAVGYGGGASIYLEKRIPLAAGLGGGSSDAAATLRGLTKLWDIDGIGEIDLAQIASRLGMDVPFFLHGGTALAEERGEVVVPLPSPHATWFVLLCPNIEMERKTAQMYGNLLASEYASGEATSRLVKVIRQGSSLDSSLLFNVFDSVADRMFPTIRSVRGRFFQISGKSIHLAGAGPTLFCLAKDKDESEQLRDRLVSEGFTAFSCRSLGPA